MSLIRRNVIRTIKNSTESTRETDTPAATTLAFDLGTSDRFYVGSAKPFASRYFSMSQVSSAAVTTTVKYWDGSAWVAVEDLVDQTRAFRESGFIAWKNPGGWKLKAQTPISDVELYWIEISVSGQVTAGATLQGVFNLFCDDNLLRAYYPELVTDTRWLPSGRSDFMEQYIAAKDLIVQRLKQSHIIDDESQVLDVNEVAIAAVHATAYIIMNPVARNDDDKATAKKAWDDMNGELAKVKLDLDFDNSGAIETNEENQGNIFRARG